MLIVAGGVPIAIVRYLSDRKRKTPPKSMQRRAMLRSTVAPAATAVAVGPRYRVGEGDVPSPKRQASTHSMPVLAIASSLSSRRSKSGM